MLFRSRTRHLVEAKAAINSPAAGARGAFSRKEEDHSQNGNGHVAHVGTFCGEGGSGERDDLLAKIKDAKKAEARPE